MRFLVLLLALASATAQAQSVEVAPAFPDLPFFEFVVDIEDPADGEDRLFIVQNKGKIYSVANDPAATERTLFLDITERVGQSTEQGIYSIAFHPDYAENGYVYVHYLTPEPFSSIIARFERSAHDPTVADPESEVVILDLPQPDATHSGGEIQFGPDGYLYLAFGDGGCCGLPNSENGQDRTNLYSTILRIDVDDPANDLNYGIPSDNPFVGNTEGWREEIWAYGLRNPWRFSIDHETGDVWVGDVGAGSWEEIDRVESGENYGWPVMEGPVCTGEDPDGCSQDDFAPPFYSYGRDLGSSVTGGYVYRGNEASDLYGRYVYADFVSGRVWALDPETLENEELADTDAFISSFGQAEDGTLFFANYFAPAPGESIYRILDGTSTDRTAGPDASALSLRLAGPNPVGARTALAFSLAEAGPARLAVYDVLGREVAVLFDGTAGPSAQTVSFATAGLAAGTYVVRLVGAGGTATERLTVLR